jgi:hypothetical protein
MLQLTRSIAPIICMSLFFIQEKLWPCIDAVPPDSNQIYSLELTGVIRDCDDNCLNKVVVNVYRDSVLYLSVTSRHNGKCDIKIPLDGKYTVIFSKEGYVSKKIIVDSEIPFSKRREYKLFFKLFLFEKVEGVDTSLFDSPVAYVMFNQFRHFDYDDTYTRIINKEAEKVYKEYYSLEEKLKSKSVLVTKTKYRNF